MRSTYFPAAAAISAIVLTVTPVSAMTNYQTFVYINGVPTDVSASATHTNGHVYLNGAWIGDLNSANQIIGSQGQAVGYVVVLAGGGG